MKKFILMLGIALIFSSITCTREADITIKLTNPSNKIVPFKLKYTPPTGGELQFRDYTPKEYTITIRKGETLKGEVYKDTLDLIDVLHFQLLLNGEEKLVNDITWGFVQKIEFQVTGE